MPVGSRNVTIARLTYVCVARWLIKHRGSCLYNHPQKLNPVVVFILTSNTVVPCVCIVFTVLFCIVPYVFPKLINLSRNIYNFVSIAMPTYYICR